MSHSSQANRDIKKNLTYYTESNKNRIAAFKKVQKYKISEPLIR